MPSCSPSYGRDRLGCDDPAELRPAAFVGKRRVLSDQSHLSRHGSSALGHANAGSIQNDDRIDRGLYAHGICRPTRNSSGKPIGLTEEALHNFWRWFGNSRVIDEHARPLILYHGTAIRKTSFRREGGCAGVGIYFIDSFQTAKEYADMDASIDGGRPIVMPVYLSMVNPYFAHGNESHSVTAERRDQLEAAGYDGIVGGGEPGDREYVAFRPEQIKSATRNGGGFDPTSSNILH